MSNKKHLSSNEKYRERQSTNGHRRIKKTSSDNFFYRFIRKTYTTIAVILFIIFIVEYVVFSSAFNVNKVAIKNITGTSRIPKDENILLVGTDSRNSIPRDIRNKLHVGSEGCNCTDTMMLIHVSYEKKIIRVFNIPRDAYVYYPSYNLTLQERSNLKKKNIASSKINAVYGYGGRDLTISIVHQMFHVNIDHYIELNFLSVVNIVDTIGGVDIYSNTPVSDKKSGLHLKTGWNHLDGIGALEYSRARYFDGLGDIGRMQRQQQLFSAILNKIVSQSSNPIAINKIVKQTSQSIYTDDKLNEAQIINRITTVFPLNNSLVGFDSMIMPIETLSHKLNDGGDAVILNKTNIAMLAYLLNHDIVFTHNNYIEVYNSITEKSNEDFSSSSN